MPRLKFTYSLPVVAILVWENFDQMMPAALEHVQKVEGMVAVRLVVTGKVCCFLLLLQLYGAADGDPKDCQGINLTFNFKRTRGFTLNFTADETQMLTV